MIREALPADLPSPTDPVARLCRKRWRLGSRRSAYRAGSRVLLCVPARAARPSRPSAGSHQSGPGVPSTVRETSAIFASACRAASALPGAPLAMARKDQLIPEPSTTALSAAASRQFRLHGEQGDRVQRPVGGLAPDHLARLRIGELRSDSHRSVIRSNAALDHTGNPEAAAGRNRICRRTLPEARRRRIEPQAVEPHQVRDEARASASWSCTTTPSASSPAGRPTTCLTQPWAPSVRRSRTRRMPAAGRSSACSGTGGRSLERSVSRPALPTSPMRNDGAPRRTSQRTRPDKSHATKSIQIQ